MTVSPDDLARLKAVIIEQRRRLEALRERAAARSVIDLASGVLVERLGCSPGEALDHLARVAAGTGTPLVDLAAELIDLTADDPLAVAARRAGGHEAPASARRLAEAAVRTVDDADEMASVMLDEVLGPLGATATALWTLAPDGALGLAGSAGFEPLEVSRWRRVPPQMDALAQRAVRHGAALWWPKPAGDAPPLMGPWTDGARAALPLPVDGAPLGVMEICWAAPLPAFPPALRSELTALARICAHTLGEHAAPGEARTALDATAVLGCFTESFLVLSPVRAADSRIVDLRIDEAGQGAAELTGRIRHRLRGRRLSDVLPPTAVPDGLVECGIDVLDTGRPGHAEWPPADDEAPVPVRLARLFGALTVTWPPEDEPQRLGGLLEQVERLGGLGGWQENPRTGQVTWTERTFALFGLPPTASPVGLDALHRHVHPDDREVARRFRERLLRHHESAVTIFRLVRADDVVRHVRASAEPVIDRAGELAAIRGAYQDVSARYHSQVALAVTQDRLADIEQRAEGHERLALELQRAILPPAPQPVTTVGLDVAVRYRPAGEGQLVGGDWYDVIVLPGKDVLLVVGDVAGHGLDAVTGMVALRNGLRGLAATGAAPGRLLGWLNNLACHLGDGVLATAICARYEPVGRVLSWARAGHLPPVLVRDGSATSLPLPAGILLGLEPDTTYEVTSTVLELGDALLLFTDGLVERRDTPVDDALRSLIRLAARPVTDAEAFSDHLLGGTSANTDDDACLVTVHVR